MESEHLYQESVDLKVKDPEQAFKKMEQAAQLGLPKAIHALADFYLDGIGTDFNIEKGVALYKEAADKGDLDAIYDYAVANSSGMIETNQEEATKYWGIGAERGHVKSMVQYSFCCAFGIGREKDNAEALKYMTKAAEAGDEEALFQLGKWYSSNSTIVEKDIRKSIEYLKKASDKGHPEATMIYTLLLEAKAENSPEDAEAVLAQLADMDLQYL